MGCSFLSARTLHYVTVRGLPASFSFFVGRIRMKEWVNAQNKKGFIEMNDVPAAAATADSGVTLNWPAILVTRNVVFSLLLLLLLLIRKKRVGKKWHDTHKRRRRRKKLLDMSGRYPLLPSPSRFFFYIKKTGWGNSRGTTTRCDTAVKLPDAKTCALIQLSRIQMCPSSETSQLYKIMKEEEEEEMLIIILYHCASSAVTWLWRPSRTNKWCGV